MVIGVYFDVYVHKKWLQLRFLCQTFEQLWFYTDYTISFIPWNKSTKWHVQLFRSITAYSMQVGEFYFSKGDKFIIQSITWPRMKLKSYANYEVSVSMDRRLNPKNIGVCNFRSLKYGMVFIVKKSPELYVTSRIIFIDDDDVTFETIPFGYMFTLPIKGNVFDKLSIVNTCDPTWDLTQHALNIKQ